MGASRFPPLLPLVNFFSGLTGVCLFGFLSLLVEAEAADVGVGTYSFEFFSALFRDFAYLGMYTPFSFENTV
ncbi:hypothetical protein AKJ63_00425 [candidate division MSBL1 archaeon SCGC-AAA259D18]|uniref:Uncharacterized protein n=1 Tax=candidate division MSBL1 archaeon SCGC-AAA259D18 TaxID=1698262 RepID=A0A133UCI7_9EURY|nr:hypothetical protein AKJ63_00425 [candidate division MSBL1 archaeon SCGC-AAA259D18]